MTDISRRDFARALLRAGALAAGGPLLACGGAASTPDPAPGDTRVVVIGAGLAGLAAARALHDAGRAVVVVEARDRIGGRTWTTTAGDATIDVGAAWIHGPTQNPASALADAAGLTRTPHVYEVWTAYDARSAAWLDDAEIEAAGAHAEGLWDAIEALGLTDDRAASLGDAMDAWLDELGLEGTARFRAAFAIEMALADAGAAPDRQSLYWAWRDADPTRGEVDMLPHGGFAGVVDLLARGLDIRLGQPVRRVEYGEAGVAVETADGVIEGTHVIVTLPLGVLAAGSVAFDPPLPAFKQSAIDRLGVGTYEKVVLTFAERFWDAEATGAQYLAGLGAERAFPYWTDISAAAGAPTLVCLYAGRFADRVQDEGWSDAAIVEGARASLSAAYGVEAPAPTAVVISRWKADPYARGAFSFIPVGASPDDMDALAEPVGARLRFAGEATARGHYATVHGALVSGLREAQRIAADAALPG